MSTDKNDKRVLMVCYFFSPCCHVGGLRSTKFVKNIAYFGWKCEVVTAFVGRREEFAGKKSVTFHHIWKIDLDDVVDFVAGGCRLLTRQLKKILRVCWQKKPAGPAGGQTAVDRDGKIPIAKRVKRWLLLPDGQIFWALGALPKILWLMRRCDLIYTSLSPYSAHLPGLIAKRLTGKPWVADYRDEWSLNCRWYPPTRFHRWLGVKLDRKYVENADIVINVTEARTQMFREHFSDIDAAKFVTIHNGYDKDDLAEFRGVELSRDCFVITSIGSLIGGRDPRPFLRAVAHLVEEGCIDRKKLKIQFIGSMYPEALGEIEFLKLGDIVRMQARLPQKEVFAQLSASHIALLVGSEMEKVAMTTKVYEYAGMGKPILGLVPKGPLHDFVLRCGGWCAEPTDMDEIKKVLRKIFSSDGVNWRRSGEVDDYVKQFERRKLTRQLVDCLESCVDKA